jgi:hypothetical protein
VNKNQALKLKKAKTKVDHIAKEATDSTEVPKKHIIKWSSIFESVIDLLIVFNEKKDKYE